MRMAKEVENLGWWGKTCSESLLIAVKGETWGKVTILWSPSSSYTSHSRTTHHKGSTFPPPISSFLGGVHQWRPHAFLHSLLLCPRTPLSPPSCLDTAVMSSTMDVKGCHLRCIRSVMTCCVMGTKDAKCNDMSEAPNIKGRTGINGRQMKM